MKVHFRTLLLETRSGLAILTLNRPDTLNALNHEMGRELLTALRQLRETEAVRAILLTGAGRAFCAGGDIKEMLPAEGRKPESFFEEPLKAFHDAILAIREIPKPVVAAVNGHASGAGCNLALACDYRVAGEGARFNQAFVRLGLVPDCGGTFTLPRLVGWGRASELILTGRVLQAREALQWGMVNEVVPDDQLMAAAVGFAEKLASGPTAAFGRAKALLNRSLDATLETQVEAERRAQLELGGTGDFLEGLRAFVDKRPPKFDGK